MACALFDLAWTFWYTFKIIFVLLTEAVQSINVKIDRRAWIMQRRARSFSSCISRAVIAASPASFPFAEKAPGIGGGV